MGKRLTFILLLSLTGLFSLALFAWALAFCPADGLRLSAEPASQAAILTGRDPGGQATELLPGELININTADEAELDRLPGIGEALAGAITQYRRENGPFGSIEEIMEVPGIGEGKFTAMKGNITIGEKGP